LKYNLKNRPTCYIDLKKEGDVEAWFEGFERELREMFKPREGKDPMFLGSQLKKEILGE